MIYLLFNLVQQYPICLHPTTIYLNMLLINLLLSFVIVSWSCQSLKFLMKGTGVPYVKVEECHGCVFFP